MILVLRNIKSKKETFFRLKSVEDFQQIFDIFPKTEDIAFRSDSLDDAARKIANYISNSSHYHAWIATTSMIKSQLDELADKKVKKQLTVTNFDKKFSKWIADRMESDRTAIPRDSTYVADPGRLREKDLDEKPDKTAFGAIRWMIEKLKGSK